MSALIMPEEDIPEMQLWITKYGCLLDTTQEPLRYHARFIIHSTSGREQRHFILGIADSSLRHYDLEDIFRKHYDKKRQTGRIISVGGGIITLDSRTILMCSSREREGDYNKEIVYPIVARWAKARLPEHQIKYE